MERAAERYGIDREGLAVVLEGQPAYRVDQVWDGLYRQHRNPSELTALPKGVRSLIDEALAPALTAVAETANAGGDTIKWLWSLDAGARIETVLMRYTDRATVCVSSQAGCAMGCGFCATGQAGFDRHLTVGEMVEQVVRAARRCSDDGQRLSNVVFMGMGEPLANYDRMWAAIERIHADLGLSARHITVSTVGIVPGIHRLRAEHLPVNLSVSLHAANDQLRDDLVPVNRRYPLALLHEACAAYLAAKGRRLTFEWALIDGVNDRSSDARELGDYARSLPLAAHVNLIPLNPTPGYAVRGTSPEGVRRFRTWLVEGGLNATIRANRGTDIAAACGQLAASSATGGSTAVEFSARTR